MIYFKKKRYYFEAILEKIKAFRVPTQECHNRSKT